MLLVHTQQKRIKLRELELVAIAGMNEANEKLLQETVQQIRKMMFPGPDPVDTEMEARKAALAREAQKVFLVKKVDPKEFMHKNAEVMRRNPEAAKLAGKVLADIERDHLKTLDRKRKVEAQKVKQDLKRQLMEAAKEQMQRRK